VGPLRIASAAAVAGVAILLAGCGAGEERRDPLVLDWQQGTYEGLRLGDDGVKLRRILGPPVVHGAEEPLQPAGEDFYEIGGLTNFRTPDLGTAATGSETLRYRRRVFLTTAHRLTAWGTTDARAQTPEGVGVGDDQALVPKRFPDADCFVQNEGTEYATYPLCRVRVCAGRLLGFGGDPIKSLWLAAETRTGLRRCVAEG